MNVKRNDLFGGKRGGKQIGEQQYKVRRSEAGVGQRFEEELCQQS